MTDVADVTDLAARPPRLESRAVLVPRMPFLHQTGRVVMQPSRLIRGPLQLPVAA